MKSGRQNISSGAKWESAIGYSRAVRVGNWISVAGTTAADENTQPVGVGDAYAQTIYIFRKIERALKEAGASLEDVIRTRIFVVRAEDMDNIGRAHGEIFGQIRPVCTMVVIKELVGPDYLVEIEADAIVSE
jgi:enamine deaminase RidA (YjgF/YER057c/UK114 family)